MTTLHVPVDGADLAVEVQGEGDALLFIHGFPFSSLMWYDQIIALTRWKRIAPDLRGAGRSSAPAPPDGYSMAGYADDLIRVLDALDVGLAVVCGLSMGGYVLLELLRRHPGRVRAAVLCNTKAEPDSADAKRERDRLAELAQREGTPWVAELLVPKLFAAATHATKPEVVLAAHDMMVRTPVPGMVGALGALRDRPDSTPTLRTIRVPTLVIAGHEDQIAPPDGMRRMAAAIRGAQFALISDAGHLTPMEQPLATNRTLAAFLDTLR